MTKPERVTAIVVDDEPLGRRGIVARLARHGRIRLLAECANGRQAIEAIRRLRPDLLFLDVQMPGLDGFDVLAALAEPERPHVLFVTAHDEHALRAFEVHALDYLLKPIDDERFDRAVRRALDAIATRRAGDFGRRVAAALTELRGEPAALDPPLEDCFVVRGSGRAVRIRFADLDWIEGAGDYVRLHAGARSWLLRATLVEAERRLAGRGFLRVHRSVIVRADRVEELRIAENGDWSLRLRDGRELRGGRAYRDAYERLAGRR